MQSVGLTTFFSSSKSIKNKLKLLDCSYLADLVQGEELIETGRIPRETGPSLKWDEGKKTVSVLLHGLTFIISFLRMEY